MVIENIKRNKPIYFIEVKLKTKYKKYMSISTEMFDNYISFKGLEIDDAGDLETELDDYDTAKKMIDTNAVYKMYPWGSIVEITAKRYVKE